MDARAAHTGSITAVASTSAPRCACVYRRTTRYRIGARFRRIPLRRWRTCALSWRGCDALNHSQRSLMHKDAEILAGLKERYPLLSMDELRGLPEAEEYDAGVYFLWQDDELQYIGRSHHILERLTHQKTVNRYAPFQNGRAQIYIPFDRHTCIVLEKGFVRQPRTPAILRDYERLYIGTYPTPYNNPNFHAFT